MIIEVVYSDTYKDLITCCSLSSAPNPVQEVFMLRHILKRIHHFGAVLESYFAPFDILRALWWHSVRHTVYNILLCVIDEGFVLSPFLLSASCNPGAMQMSRLLKA